jgi:transcriptional regulator GlxA family with amidase domain
MVLRTEINNQILIDFIKKQSLTCKHILSVCTGSFLLHKAGLLKGTKHATTHWASIDRLRELVVSKDDDIGDDDNDDASEVVEVEVIDNQRYTHDKQSNIWTSAGISAGMDMTLALIAYIAGNDMAGKVQLHTEYYPSNIIYGTNNNANNASNKNENEHANLLLPAYVRTTKTNHP